MLFLFYSHNNIKWTKSQYFYKILVQEVLMNTAPNWAAFHSLLQRALPKAGEPIPMDLPEE